MKLFQFQDVSFTIKVLRTSLPHLPGESCSQYFYRNANACKWLEIIKLSNTVGGQIITVTLFLLVA